MTEVMHVDKQIFDGNSETSASEALSSDSDIPDEDYGGGLYKLHDHYKIK